MSNDEDVVLEAMAVEYHASKSRIYRDGVVVRFSSAIAFFEANGLTTRDLLPPGIPPKPDVALMRRDLTDESYQFFFGGYQKWLRSLNQGHSPRDHTLLARELAKLRLKNG